MICCGSVYFQPTTENTRNEKIQLLNSLIYANSIQNSTVCAKGILNVRDLWNSDRIVVAASYTCIKSFENEPSHVRNARYTAFRLHFQHVYKPSYTFSNTTSNDLVHDEKPNHWYWMPVHRIPSTCNVRQFFFLERTSLRCLSFFSFHVNVLRLFCEPKRKKNISRVYTSEYHSTFDLCAAVFPKPFSNLRKR